MFDHIFLQPYNSLNYVIISIWLAPKIHPKKTLCPSYMLYIYISLYISMCFYNCFSLILRFFQTQIKGPTQIPRNPQRKTRQLRRQRRVLFSLRWTRWGPRFGVELLCLQRFCNGRWSGLIRFDVVLCTWNLEPDEPLFWDPLFGGFNLWSSKNANDAKCMVYLRDSPSKKVHWLSWVIFHDPCIYIQPGSHVHHFEQK